MIPRPVRTRLGELTALLALGCHSPAPAGDGASPSDAGAEGTGPLRDAEGDAARADAGAAPPALGDPCANDADCGAGLFCDLARCTRSCTGNDDCPSLPEWSCAFRPARPSACRCVPTGSETCDGRDNDCDGLIDDGATCPGAARCTRGACTCAPEDVCGAECVDKQSSLAHCGACATACPRGATCTRGTCACPAGAVVCDGACALLASDPAHCGSCTTGCGPLEACTAGACACAHATCGGRCTSLDDDPSHCGACDHDCNGGTCVDGLCGAVVLFPGLAPNDVILKNGTLYWNRNGAIESGSPNGTGLATIAATDRCARLAVNQSDAYCEDYASIWRVPLDGSLPAASILSRTMVTGGNLTGIAVDDAHLYWATTGSVGSADLDGSNPVILTEDQNDAHTLVLDATHLYWTNTALMYGGSRGVFRMDLDGANLATLSPDGGGGLFVTETSLVWADATAVRRSALDGTSPVLVGRGPAFRIVADDTDVYWIGDGGLFRARASGGEPTSLIGPRYDLSGLTQDDTFLYFGASEGVMRLAK